MKLTLEEYLKKVAQFAGNAYGKQIRNQFADTKGSSELAMLQCPTHDEVEQITRAVAIMTVSEKQNASDLTDEQIQQIAKDAHTDPALFAIFINGYQLELKRTP